MIVEMMANPAAGWDDAAMEENEVRAKRLGIEQTHEVQLPRSGVNVRDRSILGRVGARNA
jgi:hypothetical protein